MTDLLYLGTFSVNFNFPDYCGIGLREFIEFVEFMELQNSLFY